MTTPTLQQSVQYLQAGDLDRAEQTLRQLLLQEANNVQAWCLLGRIRQARGKAEEAIGLYQQAAKLAPEDAMIYNLAGAAWVQLRQGGQAIACLEQALRFNPFYPEAYNNLGKAHLLQKNQEQALACFREAVHLQPSFVEAANNLVLILIARKELDEARPLLEQVVQAIPQAAAPRVSLSLLHLEQGDTEKALEAARQAVQLDALSPGAQGQIGAVLLKMGRGEEAVGHLREALRLAPQHRQASEHLGIALLGLRQLDEASQWLRRALQLDPNNGRVLTCLSKVLFEQGKWTEMIQVAVRAVQAEPNSPDIFHNLGLAYLYIRQAQQAIAPLEKALQLKPNFPEALCSLGWACTDLGQYQRAVKVLQDALRILPDFPEALNNLALAHNQLGQRDEACEAYEHALRVRPDFPEALGGLANVYKDLGRLDEAIACYRKSVALNPRQATTYSNMLLSLHYAPGIAPEEIFQEHVNWAKYNAVPPAALRPHSNDPTPERRLRVGFVSADFRGHVMGWFIEPILECYNREQFEIYCYSLIGHPDDATERMKKLASGWRHIVSNSDEEVDEMIRRDQIDVLLDLGGHTGGNRLTLMVRKPAPVQASHFGYMETSGVPAIDYRITDAVCDPPGQTERYHTEQLVRLPDILWVYRPNIDLEVNALPAASAGHVTFGIFNAFPKITPQAIAVWAQILQRVPGSRLILMAGVSPKADQRLRDAFASHGIDPARLSLEGKRSRLDYFRLFHQVDLMLDSFPCAGCNTTCDSLWMGLPVVTLAGRTCMERQGASPLAHLGLHDLITQTPEEYRETAVRLATDRPRLTQLRATLRQRMSNSTLMNPQRFTRQLEDAYRWMWRQWCARQARRGLGS